MRSTENEKIEDHNHLLNIFHEYKRLGFKTAIDDFGAGYSGLNLLAKFRPDIIKLDMELIREIDKDEVQQAIVSGILDFCQKINCKVIAEGVETLEEAEIIRTSESIFCKVIILLDLPFSLWQKLIRMNTQYKSS